MQRFFSLNNCSCVSTDTTQSPNIDVSNLPDNPTGLLYQTKDAFYHQGGILRPKALKAFNRALELDTTKTDFIIQVNHNKGATLPLIYSPVEACRIPQTETVYILTGSIKRIPSLKNMLEDLNPQIAVAARISYRVSILFSVF